MYFHLLLLAALCPFTDQMNRSDGSLASMSGSSTFLSCGKADWLGCGLSIFWKATSIPSVFGTTALPPSVVLGVLIQDDHQRWRKPYWCQFPASWLLCLLCRAEERAGVDFLSAPLLAPGSSDEVYWGCVCGAVNTELSEAFCGFCPPNSSPCLLHSSNLETILGLCAVTAC